MALNRYFVLLIFVPPVFFGYVEQQFLDILLAEIWRSEPSHTYRTEEHSICLSARSFCELRRVLSVVCSRRLLATRTSPRETNAVGPVSARLFFTNAGRVRKWACDREMWQKSLSFALVYLKKVKSVSCYTFNHHGMPGATLHEGNLKAGQTDTKELLTYIGGHAQRSIVRYLLVCTAMQRCKSNL